MNIFENFHIIDMLVPVMCYAETHYKFPLVPSRLWKREPEIIADVPHRLESGAALPVLLIIKDAHRYPVELEHVTIFLRCGTKKILLSEIPFQHYPKAPYWDRIFTSKVPPGITGEVYVDVRISYKVKNKRITVFNDNYTISGRKPFRLFIDPNPLPGKDECWFGDLHYHSYFTSDQVEFGASLPATVQMAKAMGLDFFGVTDHSYDLDDCETDYLKNDPRLPKWQKLHNQVAEINRKENAFFIIPGQEVSAGNHNNRNIHMLIFNERMFFPGSGDSAEKWFCTQPEFKIENILSRLSPAALVYAAHPEIDPPFLQRLLIRRGKWNRCDYEHRRLDGLQVWNSEKDGPFTRGVKKWSQLLQRGFKLCIIAGNDAHGNFGRFRQIGFPFFTLRENESEIFAKARTGILSQTGKKTENPMELLARGCIVVTDGPFGRLQLAGESKQNYHPGDTCTEPVSMLTIKAYSSPNFGRLVRLDVYTGNTAQETERMEKFTLSGYQFETQISHPPLPQKGYIRLDILTEKKCRCLTNPVYLQRKGKQF